MGRSGVGVERPNGLRSDRPCDRAPDPAPVAGDGGSYVRVQQAWTDNAATGLGLLAAAV